MMFLKFDLVFFIVPPSKRVEFVPSPLNSNIKEWLILHGDPHCCRSGLSAFDALSGISPSSNSPQAGSGQTRLGACQGHSNSRGGWGNAGNLDCGT